MAKTKDCKVTVIEEKDEYTLSAKNKNAIYIKGITQNDIDTNSFVIEDGALSFSTTNGKNFIISKYTGIKYIKTNIEGSTKTQLLDIISKSFVDNSMNVISNYNKKKLTVTGTKYNDVIDFTETEYEPKGNANIKKNKGLTISGGYGNDSITGTGYNDVIKGGYGNDTIDGGIGNDTITGGGGENTFIYSCGKDIITDAKKGDKLEITDISKEDLIFIKYGNSLQMYDKNDTEKENTITLSNYFKSTNKIEKLIAGGEEVTLNDITIDKVTGGTAIYGTDDDDKIIASGKANVKIYSGKGNDLILVDDERTSRTMYFYEGGGNDVVDADTPERGSRKNPVKDTYVFKAGTKLSIETNWNVYGKKDVIIHYGNKNDSVCIKENEAGFIKQYVKIGTKAAKNLNSYLNVSSKDIEVYKSNSTVNGTDKGEYIYVKGDNNTINAKKGDDEIGYIGNNSTVNAGDGNDCINFNFKPGKKGQLEEDDLIDYQGNRYEGGKGNDYYHASYLSSVSTIYDEDGNDDKVSLNMSKNDIVVRFDVAVDGSGNIIESSSKNMYITGTSDFGNAEKGIKIEDQFVEGHSIEQVVTHNNGVYTLSTTEINQLRQNIAGWLHANGFESVQQIIDSNNETNINNLITEFQKADWQIAS